MPRNIEKSEQSQPSKEEQAQLLIKKAETEIAKAKKFLKSTPNLKPRLAARMKHYIKSGERRLQRFKKLHYRERKRNLEKRLAQIDNIYALHNPAEYAGKVMSKVIDNAVDQMKTTLLDSKPKKKKEVLSKKKGKKSDEKQT